MMISCSIMISALVSFVSLLVIRTCYVLQCWNSSRELHQCKGVGSGFRSLTGASQWDVIDKKPRCLHCSCERFVRHHRRKLRVIWSDSSPWQKYADLYDIIKWLQMRLIAQMIDARLVHDVWCTDRDAHRTMWCGKKMKNETSWENLDSIFVWMEWFWMISSVGCRLSA